MAGPNYGMPAFHRYTMADLRPTMPDPRCDPQFPLANYWPVYLGNFWCDVYQQHAARIQEYFGSKGLLVRMVFGRNPACDPYFYEQRRCNCYDFLVYFVSRQDAENAVYYCNREMYYGHRLNVLSGRTPAPFDTSTSAKHTLAQPDRMKITEQGFERYIADTAGARVRCIVRHSKEDFLVQYASFEDRNNAIKNCNIAMPGLIAISQTKQRFLEQSVEMEIMQWVQENPSFMNMLPPDNVLQALLMGHLQNIDQSWKTVVKVDRIWDLKLRGRKHHRRSIDRSISTRAMQLFGVACSFVHLVTEQVAHERQQRRERRKAKKIKRRQEIKKFIKNPLNR
ncbi:uncharacterized protein LOC134215617 isoform X1 [Armigeres subalbatus]|uniref:uncharacterized protein LOC134215617 isoform X1 n=1 Tax=Armigeres subalbatus TaxID=124917 RepID=UPI002ED34E09